MVASIRSVVVCQRRWSEETVDFAGLAGEADVIDGADFTAFLVLETLGQTTSFNH